MDSLDQTTLSTISLLESRLLRIGHLLHGTSASSFSRQHDSAPQKMNELEWRFNKMLSNIRVYTELLKICAVPAQHLLPGPPCFCSDQPIDKSNPDLFHAPAPSDPPSQLDPDAIQSIVMAAASSFPATLSALTAIKDIPIPDPSASATLITLSKRMKAIEATQLAQASEVAALRSKSEALVRTWYEDGAVVNSQLLADAEGRVQKVERVVRRRERQIEDDKEEASNRG